VGDDSPRPFPRHYIFKFGFCFVRVGDIDRGNGQNLPELTKAYNEALKKEAEKQSMKKEPEKETLSSESETKATTRRS